MTLGLVMVDAEIESQSDSLSVPKTDEGILTSEHFWYALDRQMLGSGLRLILILPAFSIFTSFGKSPLFFH